MERILDFMNIILPTTKMKDTSAVPIDKFIKALKKTRAAIMEKYPDASDLKFEMILSFSHYDTPTIIFRRNETEAEKEKRTESPEEYELYLKLKEKYEV